MAEEGLANGDGIARFVLSHDHLVGPALQVSGGDGQRLSHGPEAQQPDAELSLDSLGALFLEGAFQGIPDVGGDIGKVRDARGVPRDAFPVIYDPQVTLCPVPCLG